jgi:hypothetical protein
VSAAAIKVIEVKRAKALVKILAKIPVAPTPPPVTG